MTGKGHRVNLVAVAIILLVLGVLMVIFSDGDKGDTSNNAESIFSEAEYEKGLESRLTELIRKIDGVGEVSVMVTLEGSAVYNYATDTAQDNKADGDSKRESTVVLSAKGSNTKEAVVSGYSLPDIKGAAVVCSTTLTPSLQAKVIGVVSAALGISTSKIYVTN